MEVEEDLGRAVVLEMFLLVANTNKVKELVKSRQLLLVVVWLWLLKQLK